MGLLACARAAHSRLSLISPQRCWGLLPCCMPVQWPFRWSKFAGVAYLLFMAYKMLKDKEQFDADHLDDASVQGPSALGIVRDGILLNLLNPKTVDLFSRFPTAIHRCEYSKSDVRYGGIGRHLHGDDASCFRPCWCCCGLCAGQAVVSSCPDGLVEARLCCDLCGAWCEARSDATLIVLSSLFMR